MTVRILPGTVLTKDQERRVEAYVNRNVKREQRPTYTGADKPGGRAAKRRMRR